MAKVKKVKKVKKAQDGALGWLKGCTWDRGEKPYRRPIGQAIGDFMWDMKVRRADRKQEKENRREAKNTATVAGPPSPAGMWHPNNPEFDSDPSAPYWQERDYNEAMDVGKRVAKGFPLRKKQGGKVVKKAAVKKAAPKKAAVKKTVIKKSAKKK